MLLPPTMPLTFQVRAVLVVPLIDALNCRVRRTRTEALVGEMVIVTLAGAAVTDTNSVFDISPSAMDAMTATEDLAAGALPVAVSRVADTKVVARGAPSNETTAPGAKPAPSTVRVKLPTGIEAGLIDVRLACGKIVTDADPLAPGDAVLVARTVTTPAPGTLDGAR